MKPTVIELKEFIDTAGISLAMYRIMQAYEMLMKESDLYAESKERRIQVNDDLDLFKDFINKLATPYEQRNKP